MEKQVILETEVKKNQGYHEAKKKKRKKKENGTYYTNHEQQSGEWIKRK